MLLALETAITDLLKAALPELFTGADPVGVTFPSDTWDFDPLSADPVAGQPGPEDAVDDLPFHPSAPGGPYHLTRPPYPGPKRVYLHSAAGELVPLGNPEVKWDRADPASFTVTLRPGRDASGFDHLQVLYGVVAAATHLKARHKFTVQIAGNDATAEKALPLVLATLALNRDALMSRGGFSSNSGNYQAQGVFKSLKLSGGQAAAATRTLNLEAEIDLRVERLLSEDEGKPIAWILSPGRPAGRKPVDVDPAVQA